MPRALHARPIRMLYLLLAIALSVAGAAPPAPPVPIGNLTDQRRALYQSELEQNLVLRTGLGYERSGRVLGWTLAKGQHAYSSPPDQAGHAEQSTTDDATQRELAERWTYYYHATRMSPAELKAWMQAKQRADTAIQPPAQAPAPARPAQPTGQPGWLVVGLGVLAAVLALVAGLALVAARRATRRARLGQAT
jgi:hypothetical protein